MVESTFVLNVTSNDEYNVLATKRCLIQSFNMEISFIYRINI